MTKTKNFPGRKNERRRAVLARLRLKKNPTELEAAVIKLIDERVSEFPSEGKVFTKKRRG